MDEQGRIALRSCCTQSEDSGSGNIVILRRRARDTVRRDTSKGSLSIKLKLKLKRAGWDDNILRNILNSLAA